MAVMLQEHEIVQAVLDLDREVGRELRYGAYKARELKNDAIVRMLVSHDCFMGGELSSYMDMQAKHEFKPTADALKNVLALRQKLYSPRDMQNHLLEVLRRNKLEGLDLMLTSETNPMWLTSTLEQYEWTNSDLAKTFKHCCAIRTLVRSGYVVSGSNWHEICCSGNLLIMEYLLLTGVDVDLRGSSSNTALMAVCARGEIEPEVLSTLLQHGADVNAENSFSMTPLRMFLARWSLNSDAKHMQSVLNMFFRRGANLWHINDDGRNVFDAALISNTWYVFELCLPA